MSTISFRGKVGLTRIIRWFAIHGEHLPSREDSISNLHLGSVNREKLDGNPPNVKIKTLSCLHRLASVLNRPLIIESTYSWTFLFVNIYNAWLFLCCHLDHFLVDERWALTRQFVWDINSTINILFGLFERQYFGRNRTQHIAFLKVTTAHNM